MRFVLPVAVAAAAEADGDPPVHPARHTEIAATAVTAAGKPYLMAVILPDAGEWPGPVQLAFS